MTTTLRTTTTERTATKRAPMDKMRRTALTAGVFYLITFVSIPTLALYGPCGTTGTGSSAPAPTLGCSWAASLR